MIIESVRSIAVPEEGRPYRKIKVSADAKTKLPPEVIKDAVSTYIREKVNHIVRGDCVVEVHWNGIDLRTLHLRSIQPLSAEEAERQRKESAARISQGGARVAVAPALTTTELKKVASAPLRLDQPASYVLMPASAAQTSTSSDATQSSPNQILSNGKPDAAQTKLRVVTINRMPNFQSNIPVNVAPTVNRLSIRPQNAPTLAVGQKIHIESFRPTVRTLTSSIPATSLVTVTRLNQTNRPPAKVIVPIERQVISTNNPSMVARNGVRLIVSATPSDPPPKTDPTPIMATSAAGPSHEAPVIRRFHPQPPGYIPPPGSRIIRMRAARPVPPVVQQTPVPSGNIRPSNTWSAQTASREEEVVLQPTIAPTQVPTVQFAAPQTTQPLATIAPVLTVRQVAASNSNLSVRINGSVIRAVPGQVIRRVTGEIVRVLDNGTLEPVDLQPPPKTIMSSRDKPISLDSDSEDSSDSNSSDSDFVVIKSDRNPKREKTIPSGKVLRKIDLSDDKSADSARTPAEPVSPTETDPDSDAYDSALLSPAVDFSEGDPLGEDEIEQLKSQSAVPRQNRTVSLFPDLTEAMIVNDEGEMILDPDLFEDYINRLAIRFGYLKQPKPADSISYLFLRRAKPKSQCVRYIPKANLNVLGSANIARNPHTVSDDASSSDSADAEPLRKRLKRPRPRRTSEELLLDACPRRKRDADNETDEPAIQVRPRTRKVRGIRMMHLDDIEKPPPISPDLVLEEPQQCPKMYTFKGVRVSEPVECFDSFVVMDKLKTPKNNHTVHLDGLLKTRSGVPLFEMREGDMFFNLRSDRVNRSAKLRFESLTNPLRPIKDPVRGALVAKMAIWGIPKQPARSESVPKAVESQSESDPPISNSTIRADLTNLKSESNHENQRTVKLEQSNENSL